MAEAFSKQGVLSLEDPTILIGEGPFNQKDLKGFLVKHGLEEANKKTAIHPCGSLFKPGSS